MMIDFSDGSCLGQSWMGSGIIMVMLLRLAVNIVWSREGTGPYDRPLRPGICAIATILYRQWL